MEFSGFREFICCGRDAAPGALAGDYIATLRFAPSGSTAREARERTLDRCNVRGCCPFAADPFRVTFELAV